MMTTYIMLLASAKYAPLECCSSIWKKKKNDYTFFFGFLDQISFSISANGQDAKLLLFSLAPLFSTSLRLLPSLFNCFLLPIDTIEIWGRLELWDFVFSRSQHDKFYASKGHTNYNVTLIVSKPSFFSKVIFEIQQSF